MKSILLPIYLLILASSVTGQFTPIDSIVTQYPLIIRGKVTEAHHTGIKDLGTYPVRVTIERDSIYKTNWIMPETLVFTVNFTYNDEMPDIAGLESQFDPYRSASILFLPDKLVNGQSVYIHELDMVPERYVDKNRLRYLTNRYRTDISLIPFYQKDSSSCKLCELVDAGKWNRVEREIKRVLKRSWRSDKMNKQDVYDWLGSKPCVKYLYTDVICLTLFPMTCGFGVVFQTPEGLEERYVSIRYGKIYRLFGLTLGSSQNAKKFLGMSDNQGGAKQWAKNFRSNFINQVPLVLPNLDSAIKTSFPSLAYFHHAYLEGPQYSMFGLLYAKDEWKDELKRWETEGYVYHLCLLTLHYDPSVRLTALEALRRLGDPKAIPFLIRSAEHQSTLYLPPARDIPEHQNYCIELVRTLNALTGLRLPAETVPFNQVNYGQRLIQTALPSWRAQIMNGELEIPN